MPADVDDLLRLVVRLHDALGRAGERLVAASGLTRAQRACLAAVAVSPASVADVAAAQGLARQSVQRVADDLVAAGLATYQENPRHRRAKLLAVSPRGRRALDRSAADHAAWVESFGARLDERVVRRLTRDLNSVLEVVDR